jgi:hypothetical protein
MIQDQDEHILACARRQVEKSRYRCLPVKGNM